MLRTLLVMFFSFALQEEIMAQKTNGHPTASEQALIVSIRLSDASFGTHEEREKLFKLEDKLITAIKSSSAGEYDGNEIGGGTFTMYMYGASTARLWEVVSPIIRTLPPATGSYAIERYGGPGAKEDRIPL